MIYRITPAHAGKTRARSRFSGTAPDHPRACGENFKSRSKKSRSSGSPPRMRGKPPSLPSAFPRRRITPAHAGKTLKFLCFRPPVADHPRACGENGVQFNQSGVWFGSPPRMRGKHAHILFENSVPRITPAHAGKTADSVPDHYGYTDHPRACGENTSEMAYFRG